ncbi:MAG: F-box protein [Simkaniaceae bacterium]
MNNSNIPPPKSDFTDYNPFIENNSKNFIDEIPPEILSIILSKLDNKSIENASTVCRHWKEISLDVAHRAQSSAIEAYVNSIRNELKEQSYADQLLEINSNIKNFKSENLIEINSFVKKQKNLLINILKDLEEDDLKRLEELVEKQPTPKFFGNLFTLAKLYRQIDLAKQSPDNFTKSKALQDISEELANNGNFEKSTEVALKAVEFALMIPDNDSCKFMALKNIPENLAKNGDFEKAVEVALMIPNSWAKSKALQNISEVLKENGDFEKAVEVALMIPNSWAKSKALQNISEVLKENGDFEKAVEVALMIPNNWVKSLVLKNISENLTKNGDFEKAIEVALMIPDNFTKSKALQAIPKKAKE